MSAFLPAIFMIIIGLVVLVAGGDLLVRGASKLAAYARISPLVIGLTVVAMGTGAPELAVTLQSCLNGETDLAVGNVVGSNIVNVLLVLGLSALLAPLVVSSQLVRWDVPVMIAASFSLLILGWDGVVSRIDGTLCVVMLLMYFIWSVIQSRKESVDVQQELTPDIKVPGRASWKDYLVQGILIALGLILLGFGSHILVRGCVTIAEIFGVSQLLIGLTILSIGTSLPEVVASLMATVRGQREIAVGNVVGSNLFNILGALGLSAVLAPNGVAVSHAALHFDIPVMIAVAVACLPIFFTGHLIARWEGGLFFGYYVAYLTYLVLRASAAPLTTQFSTVMIVFVIPLTIITLLIGVYRSLRGGPRG